MLRVTVRRQHGTNDFEGAVRSQRVVRANSLNDKGHACIAWPLVFGARSRYRIIGTTSPARSATKSASLPLAKTQ